MNWLTASGFLGAGRPSHRVPAGLTSLYLPGSAGSTSELIGMFDPFVGGGSAAELQSLLVVDVAAVLEAHDDDHQHVILEGADGSVAAALSSAESLATRYGIAATLNVACAATDGLWLWR